MSSLMVHSDRSHREEMARQEAEQVVTLPPQQGMTTKTREHAAECTCRHSEEYGYIIGAACVQEWGKAAAASLNQAKQVMADPEESPHGG